MGEEYVTADAQRRVEAEGFVAGGKWRRQENVAIRIPISCFGDRVTMARMW